MLKAIPVPIRRMPLEKCNSTHGVGCSAAEDLTNFSSYVKQVRLLLETDRICSRGNRWTALCRSPPIAFGSPHQGVEPQVVSVRR
jgi:hypothetical protein